MAKEKKSNLKTSNRFEETARLSNTIKKVSGLK